ncbi:MAG: peptidase U32 family protein, partial [Candidatus Hermodarchaeota archaeon]
CTIAYIPQFIEANIDAFKIEGRMRHPHYVEIVSKVYREAIEAFYDGKFSDSKVGKWVTELKKVYNRGFTPGFYFKRMTEEDHQHRSPTNLSHYRYIRVGNIKCYDKKTGFANISLNNGYLMKGDDIIIMGKKSDTYLHQTVKFLHYNGKQLNKTSRGTKQKEISVDLKVNEPVIGNSIDKVYVFTDKTYFKQKYTL